MIQNYRGKNAKDIETAAESLITSPTFTSRIPDSVNSTPKLTVTFQQQNTEGIDSILEKKK